MISDNECRKLHRNLKKNQGNLSMSARESGMDRKTARKYRNGGKLPSEIKKERKKREGEPTRKSPFEAHEAELKELWLENQQLQPMTLLQHLLDSYPDAGYKPSLLRTLQRRVRDWKKEVEDFRAAQFAQEWHPGKVAQLDWTHMDELGVSIGGSPFSHRLCHLIFPHSNWSWGTVCFSESLLSLKQGLQAACCEAGGYPHVLQTDNSSSCTHKLSRKDKEEKLQENEGSASSRRGFNDKYIAFLKELEIKPETIPVGCSNANADIESRNGKIKNFIDQQLMLRGSRDFADRGAYDLFLQQCFHRFNERTVGEVFGKEEKPLLQPLLPVNLPNYEADTVKVSRESLIRIDKNIYSVPNKLIGETLDLEIYEDHIRVFQKGKGELFRIDKLHGRGKANIDFRHLIQPLLRKVGAFRNYRYHAHFFPGTQFRCSYDRLCSQKSQRSADRIYLELLSAAADYGVVKIDSCLQDIFAEGLCPSLEELNKRLQIPPEKHDDIELIADLSAYACFDTPHTETKP